jgi:hypothetical protein
MKNRLPLRTLELLQVFTFKFEVVSVGWFVVCNATFNNISVVSWRSVLLVDETGVTGDNHRPVASHRGGEKSVCHKWVSIVWFLVLAFPEPWVIY